MTDPSSWQGGRSTTNKTAAVLTTSKIWSWVGSPRGAQRQDGRTDWLTDRQVQSDSDSWLWIVKEHSAINGCITVAAGGVPPPNSSPLCRIQKLKYIRFFDKKKGRTEVNFKTMFKLQLYTSFHDCLIVDSA
jgi:hypothetical protein